MTRTVVACAPFAILMSGLYDHLADWEPWAIFAALTWAAIVLE